MIKGSDALVARLGYWPSFHDSEVVRVILERKPNPSVGCASVDVLVYYAEATVEYEDDIHFEYGTKNELLIGFRFDGVDGVVVGDFNHQNVIDDIVVEPAAGSDLLQVTFESIFGAEVSLKCKVASIVSIEEAKGWRVS